MAVFAAKIAWLAAVGAQDVLFFVGEELPAAVRLGQDIGDCLADVVTADLRAVGKRTVVAQPRRRLHQGADIAQQAAGKLRVVKGGKGPQRQQQ